MSSPSSPTQASPSIPRVELASAAERRASHEEEESHHRSKREIELRKQFWRLISPGIIRPNPIETALASMKVLETLASNVLKEPENPKYLHFKPTNKAIKRHLVDVKGALEYAVALGFHSQVEDMQQVYVFSERHMEELRVGYAVLTEAIEQESAKHVRGKYDLKADKEAKAIAARNALLAFEEDRREKAMRDQREAEARRALEAEGHHIHVPSSPSSPTFTTLEMGGHVLGEQPGSRRSSMDAGEAGRPGSTQ